MQTIKQYVREQLNDEQYQAAISIDTASLILAGAGSWKTRTLTYKIAYLLYGHNVPPSRILAVTFTNKAANEMKERLVHLTEEMQGLANDVVGSHGNATNDGRIDNTSLQGDDIDSFISAITTEKKQAIAPGYTVHDFQRIGTFHWVFLKILKEDIEKRWWPYTKNFTIFDANEAQSIVKDAMKKFNCEELFKVAEVKNFISKLKNEGTTPDKYLKDAKTDYEMTMGKLYQQYQKDLEITNAMDFDDLLMIPYLMFREKPEILAKWKDKFIYVMVDEAQDTNWIQFELMKMLSGENGNITLIGDDFQSIYGRRGAVMENFLQVKKYRPGIQMFKLETNYRSRPHIVDAGTHIISHNKYQYEKVIKPHRTGNDKIVLFSHRDEMDEAVNTIDLIKKMKDQKFDKRGDVAILYRTNAQSSPFEQILVQEGIPYKIWGAFKFFERKEIKDIVWYLKYLINPRDSVSLKRIINVPWRKIGKTTLDGLEQYAISQELPLHDILMTLNSIPVKVTPQAKNSIQNFLFLMQQLKEKIDHCSPAQLLQWLAETINYRDHLIKEEGSDTKGDEKYENVGQLINMAEKYDAGEEQLRQFMEEVALLTDISENEQGDIDAIKLMTVHASKGLEFPFVFVVGIEEHVFPLANSMLEPKTLEEERRLMYVAVTRAKDHLFLSYASSRMQRWQTKMNPPSRFLKEIPEELLKQYDLTGGASDSMWRQADFDEGDLVKHKLFWPGVVLEVRNTMAIIQFHNPKYWVRKIECRFLSRG